MNEEMLVLEYSLSVEYEQINRIFFLPSEPFEYEMMGIKTRIYNNKSVFPLIKK